MYFLLYLRRSMETVRIIDLTDFVEDYYLEELERHCEGSDFWEHQEVYKTVLSANLFRDKYCNSYRHLLIKL